MAFPGLSAAPLLLGRRRGFISYAQFLLHIQGLADGTFGALDSAGLAPNGEILITPVSPQGVANMWGSSWGVVHTYDSRFIRVIQHGLPSEAVYNSVLSNARVCLVNRTVVSDQATFGVTRNGYTSASYTSYQCRRCDRILYWDDTLGGAFEINPFAMSSPLPYAGGS